MLIIQIPSTEYYDHTKNEFIYSKSYTISLEHSLVSISKWESKWCIPFLNKQEKTQDQLFDYINCMLITQNIDPEVLTRIGAENITRIQTYIDAKMTATVLPKPKVGGIKEVITADIIYYWMVSLSIPFECQKWHLNRLLTLINVCNIKNSPAKKLGKGEILSRNAALNAARKKELGTKG